MSCKQLPYVSVVIPVYNDNTGLKKCLLAVFNQSYDQNLYEVIVVDNNSKEDVQKLCLDLENNEHKKILYFREKKQSSYAARNKGINKAKGDIIAFTDSDCIPKKSWLKEGVLAIQGKNADLAGGNIRLIFKNKNNLNHYELYDSLFSFKQKNNIIKKKQGVTANLFVKNVVFNTIDRFNDKLQSGGDVDLCRRAIDSGFDIVYAPNAIIYYPARASFDAHAKKARRVMRGLYKSNKRMFFIKVTVSPFVRIILLLNNKISFTNKLKVILVILKIYFVQISESIKIFYNILLCVKVDD